MKKIELLLPAGNLEKLKYAVLYGADSVYVGGKILSLRAQASNFSLEDIKEGCEFVHKYNKKLYVTVNVIPREYEIPLVKDYLINLEKLGVDGIIVSSPSIIKIAKTYTNLHISVSTQASISSLYSTMFYHDLGANRVVLSRELSLDEIEYIRKNTDTELEVFIHGGMCSAYSGRCTLSNYFSLRDANSGGCAHSCRWNYDVYKDNKKLNNEFFRMGSKDLVSIKEIKRLVDMGVECLKIEGRMKSISYISTVAYTYRRLIDDIYSNNLRPYEYYEYLLGDAQNREAASGFLNHEAGLSETLYVSSDTEANKNFLGIVLSSQKDNTITLEVRNYFENDEEIEILSPGEDIKYSKITELSKDGVRVDAARHALEVITFKSNIPLKIGDLVRRKK